MLVAAIAIALSLGTPTVMTGARYIDVASGKAIVGAAVVIEGDRIVACGRRSEVQGPEGAARCDVGELTILPGLIDAHVHLAWGPADPAAASDTVVGANEALLTLRAGFTTVRNLGSTGWADLALRDAIAAGRVVGPRILAAGPALGTPDGVCAQVFAGEGIVRDPEDARRKVRELATRGVDVVKVCAGGSVLGVTPQDEQACELSLETLQAVVEEAHAKGLRVAAHAQGPRAIANAVRAGVDSIEHGSQIDDECAALMKEHGVVLVPTLYRLDWQWEDARQRGTDANALKPLERAREVARKRVQHALGLGVPVACGTDATVFPHGLNAREVAVLVEVGLTRERALAATTIDAAKLLGLQDEIGSIDVGKRADLIAVAGDPLEDITALQRVVLVMRNGVIVKDERAR